jgi:DNA helicase MCM8
MDPIPIYYLKKFIAYARRYIHPRLSLKAARLLQKKYLEMRHSAENNASDSVPITTRQLESLLRLAQARAKAEFSEIVTEEHAQDVVDIMQECLLDTVPTDGDDGSMDFGRKGGMSLAKKVKAYVARLMKAVERKNDAMFSFEELLEVANAMGLKVDDFRDFVDILRNECYILKKGPRQYKVQVSSMMY